MEGTRGIPGSEGQSRRFGANETARNREPEDAARERRRETSGEKPPAKRRVEDMARSTLMHFPTLTDRRSGLDAGRDARARGHERVSSETRPSRMAHARRRSGEHARELRARPRARCRSRSETASRSVERFRAARGKRRGRRCESKRDRGRRAAGFVPYRLRSDRCARLGRASSARA